MFQTVKRGLLGRRSQQRKSTLSYVQIPACTRPFFKQERTDSAWIVNEQYQLFHYYIRWYYTLCCGLAQYQNHHPWARWDTKHNTSVGNNSFINLQTICSLLWNTQKLILNQSSQLQNRTTSGQENNWTQDPSVLVHQSTLGCKSQRNQNLERSLPIIKDWKGNNP